jgi:hypothetical protein
VHERSFTLIYLHSTPYSPTIHPPLVKNRLQALCNLACSRRLFKEHFPQNSLADNMQQGLEGMKKFLVKNLKKP